MPQSKAHDLAQLPLWVQRLVADLEQQVKLLEARLQAARRSSRHS